MKLAAIIAEYNPFHNGHALHIARTREAGCGAVVCIMAGHLTQRGEFAALSKWSRARAALLNGADAVIELPAVFACRTADKFAGAGVALAAAMGADFLSFGCETDDLSALMRLADARADASAGMARGETLPRALASAGIAAPGPNAILAVEYLRAMRNTPGAPAPMIIRREGDYHSEALGDMASATAIRLAAEKGDAAGAAAGMPANAAFQIGEMENRHGIDDLYLRAIREAGPEGLKALPDVREGLENLIFSAAMESATIEETLSRAKCKRYTMARLRRLCAHALTGLTTPLAEKCPAPDYIRLIGARGDAGDILKEVSHRAKLPIAGALDLRGDACFEFERRVTDLWALTRNDSGERRGGQEFTRRFVRV